MINHKSYALEGLFPGLTNSFSVATLGAYVAEIIIEPVIPAGGGGYFAPLTLKDVKYIIRIKIWRGDKVWEIAKEVDGLTAKVTAEFLGKKLPDHPLLAITFINQPEQDSVTVTVVKRK